MAVCLALLAGSYLTSGLINASPITQPDLRGPRARTVIVTPVAPAQAEPEEASQRLAEPWTLPSRL